MEFFMFKIDLSIYKKSKQYFILFDVLFKYLSVNKDFFLKENGVSPSSYRKARSIEQNNGNKIIDKLCKVLNYKNINNELIDEIELLINRIYNNMYYKVYTTYEKDLSLINEYLESNIILRPIVLLSKLFLLANYKYDVGVFVNENNADYIELKKYLPFFSNELLELFDILSLVFEKNIQDKVLMKTYKNSLFYYALSSRLCSDKRYVESLFVSKKAEDVLVREKNYKRLLYLNVKMMHCMNSIKNYEECFELASMQLLSLRSFIDVDYAYKNTVKNLAISCLPLKKYSYVVDLLLNEPKLSMTEVCCLLVSQFNLDIEKYNEYFDFYYNGTSIENQAILANLDSFLKHNDKKELMKLEETKLMDNITIAIKMSQLN